MMDSIGARNNRNILECKCCYHISIYATICEIIETYWNVNKEGQKHRANGKAEIIETYWNVNYFYTYFYAFTADEIIETYWNVNDSCLQTS